MFCLEIRQGHNFIADPAFDYTGNIVPVDLADGMIIRRIVEWPELAVIYAITATVITDVVGDNVHH